MTSEAKNMPDHVAAALAYVTFIPAIALLLLPPYNQNPYVRFHAWQSVFLAIATFVISFVVTLMTIFGILFGAFPVLRLNTMVWVAWLLAWLVCIAQAFKGERFHLPLLGRLAERQARL